MLHLLLMAALAQPVAAEVPVPPAAASSATLAALADAPTWRILLGFEPLHEDKGNRRKAKPAESDIISSDFFLASDGSHDPQAELIATKQALEAPVTGDPDQHAQCRFPARLMWLEQQHVLRPDLQHVTCPAYDKWLSEAKPNSASIIFASGHLTNPATFYGHMMLRLGTDTNDGHDTLLDPTLNYGAVLPDHENGLVYVARGLSGQYTSIYTVLPFYQHLNRFNEVQNRDVWEYKLDLTDDQTRLLAAHAWEHLKASNRYYYLRQNCAYRIVELLSAVTDAKLVPEKPWVMPVDVLETLSRARNGDHPLVRSVERLESRQTRLRDKYLALAGREQTAVNAYLRSPERGVQPALANLTPDGRKRVVETLIDYYSASEAEKPLTPAEESDKHDLVLARFRLPAGAADYGDIAKPAKPHEGQKSTLFQVLAGSNSELGEGLELRFRPAYNDFLSRAPGSLPYSELSFGDLRIGLYDGKISLRAFDALRITTLNVSQTGLPRTSGFSWRMRAGAEQAFLGCTDCVAAHFEADWGQSFILGEHVVAYGLAGGRLRSAVSGHGTVDAGLTGGLIFNAKGAWRTSGEVNLWHDVTGGGRPTDTIVRLETRYGTSSRWDLSASAAWQSYGKQSATEFRGGLSYFW